MKGKIVTLFGTAGALGLLAGNAAAHPGHSPADVTAQLASPLSGPDHLLVFVTAGVLLALGAARAGLYLLERRRSR